MYGQKWSMQAWASSRVSPPPADHWLMYRMVVMWSKTTASVTSRSSLIMSMILAGFHMSFDKALHPWQVVSWTVVSKQWFLPKSILLWFWSGFLTMSLTCSCVWSMHSRSCMSPMRDTLEWSTDASLLGKGDVVLASSSWQSTSEGPGLPFDWVGDSCFEVLLLLMLLFLLGILAFKLLVSKSQQ